VRLNVRCWRVALQRLRKEPAEGFWCVVVAVVRVVPTRRRACAFPANRSLLVETPERGPSEVAQAAALVVTAVVVVATAACTLGEEALAGGASARTFAAVRASCVVAVVAPAALATRIVAAPVMLTATADLTGLVWAPAGMMERPSQTSRPPRGSWATRPSRASRPGAPLPLPASVRSGHPWGGRGSLAGYGKRAADGEPSTRP
jgi:hypothetical protein